MNTTGHGYFKKGNAAAAGKGRPVTHDTVKLISEFTDDTKRLPSTLLSAIAHREDGHLKRLGIPIKQVTQHVQLLAAGLLFLRGTHE